LDFFSDGCSSCDFSDELEKVIVLTLNEELARAEGLNKVAYELLFMFLIALAVSVSVQIVGVLLITSLLIIPPAIARVYSRSPLS